MGVQGACPSWKATDCWTDGATTSLSGIILHHCCPGGCPLAEGIFLSVCWDVSIKWHVDIRVVIKGSQWLSSF